MALREKNLVVVFHTLMWMVLFLLCSRVTVSNATVTDVECLKSIKESLIDPYNYLNSTWDFNNNTEGFICRFMGIDCWHPDENRVLNIRLSDLGLKGQFPRGIQKCTSLTGLDLSHNKLSGSVPADISKLIPYATSLDLSFNNFSGSIPLNLANCTFLNNLKLDNNRLTGSIPLQFGLLDRIKTFSVTNNLLSGPIPVFVHANIPAESYANNTDLCGKPLKSCPGVPKKSRLGVIAAAAAGGITFTSIAVGIFLYYLSRGLAKRKKEDDPEGNRWAKSIKGTKGIKVDILKNKLGFDQAFNYKEEPDLNAALKRYFPEGIDIYFDNVGGEMLEAALLNMRIHGRIAVCGMVSSHSLSDSKGIRNLFSLITKRIKMQGFLQSDYLQLYPRFFEHVVSSYKQRKVVYIEDINEGLESAHAAFVGLFSGKNVGKQVVRVGRE